MKNLLQIKPVKILLLHFVLIALSILTFVIWAKLVSDFLIPFGFAFIIIGCIGGYLLWIYALFVGFKYLDNKNKLTDNFSKSKVLLLSILVIYIVMFVLLMLDTEEETRNISFVISIILATILTYAFFEVVILLTKKFKFYDEKPQPILWDYFVTLLLLSFYPFGILIMHSHLRLILKQKRSTLFRHGQFGTRNLEPGTLN